MNEQAKLIASLTEFKNSIKGLSLEVEGLRLNNNSNSDFILDALRDLLVRLNKVLDEANSV